MNRYTLMPYITGLAGGAALALSLIRNPFAMLFGLAFLAGAIYLAVSHREISSWKRVLTKVALTVPVGIAGLIFFFNPLGLLFGGVATIIGIWAIQKFWLKEDTTIIDSVTESETAEKVKNVARAARPAADLALHEIESRLDQTLRDTQAKAKRKSDRDRRDDTGE